ncbi:MAG: pitrilysin family protein, partial [Bacteroidota bacterium]
IGHDVGDEVVSLQLSMVSKQFAQMLPLFRELLCEPIFPEENFAQMKARAQQNLLTAAQKTNFQARRRFGHLLYGENHPYGRHLGPTELEALSLGDIRAYRQQYLVPANSVLAICGRFDTQAVLAILEEQLGSIPAGNAPTLTDYSEQAPSNRCITEALDRPGPQSTVRTGHLSLSRYDQDYVGMRVLMTLLGGFFGSRLMKKIREEKGYTYGVYAALSGRPRYGQIVVQTDVANAYVDDTLSLIREEIKRLQDHAPDEAELQLVKNYMLGQSLNQRETAFQLGSILRYHIASGIGFTEMEQRFVEIEAMSRSKIRALAQKWLRPEQMLTVICGGAK